MYGLMCLSGYIVFGSILQAIEGKDDTLSVLLGLFDPEHVLSFLVVLIVIGVGRWFGRSGWPWWVGYASESRELGHKLRLAEMQLRERLAALETESRENEAERRDAMTKKWLETFVHLMNHQEAQSSSRSPEDEKTTIILPPN